MKLRYGQHETIEFTEVYVHIVKKALLIQISQLKIEIKQEVIKQNNDCTRLLW